MNEKERKFKEIYKQSQDKIYRLCLGFMGNKTDADDLFQEVYIKVWSNLHSFRNESNINTWIYRIATNTAISFSNKRVKSNEVLGQFKSESLAIEVENNQTDYSEKEIMKLYETISSLKERDRIIISLVLEQNTYAEIAEIVGMTVSNVGAKVSRIKKALTKRMRSYGK